MLNNKVSYKELGADYVHQQREDKRKAYLKKEIEALGYAVELKKIGYTHTQYIPKENRPIFTGLTQLKQDRI